MIWLSVNRDRFIAELPQFRLEKILPLPTALLWGDYPSSGWQLHMRSA
jgi:hypothetical protein